MSAFVKGFGYRPITTVGPDSRPVSESRQGRNPREMRKRLRRKLYGDFWFLVGVGENGFEKGTSVEVMWKEAGGFRRMPSTERRGSQIGSGGHVLVRSGRASQRPANDQHARGAALRWRGGRWTLMRYQS
jgi:hypothetical protein